MTACESCWGRAYTRSRMFGGSQVDRYHEELANHRHTDDAVARLAALAPSPKKGQDQ